MTEIRAFGHIYKNRGLQYVQGVTADSRGAAEFNLDIHHKVPVGSATHAVVTSAE